MNGLVLCLDAANPKSYPSGSGYYYRAWSGGWSGSFVNATNSFDGNLSTSSGAAGGTFSATYTFSGGLNVSGTVRVYVVFGASSGQVNGRTGVILVDGIDISSKMAAANLYVTAGWVDVTSEVGSTFNTIVLNGTSGSTNPGIYAIEVDGQILIDNTTLTDISGNSNTGTLTNGPTYSSANGGFIVFDGTNDYVSFTSNCYNIPLNGTITELTIDAWVYWNSFPLNSIDEIVSWWEDGTQTYSDGFLGVTCTANGGGTNTNPMIRFGDDWANTGSSFTASTDVNKWWNIVAVKTSNNAYVYKNSILSATKGSSLSWGFNNVLNIGRQHAAGEYINARIPNIKLYNRALSAAEVSQNFNALRGRYGL